MDLSDQKNDVKRDQKILFEQISVLLKSAYFILITYALTAGAYLYVMWGEAEQTLLISWAIIFLFVLLIRAAIHHYYHDKIKPENARYYGLYIIISLGITGLVWGVGVALMFPQVELSYQFFIVFIIAGIGGSAFSSNTIFLPGLYAFFPALLLPLAFRMLLMEETLYLAMGSMVLVFTTSLYFFSRNLNKTLVETLKLRYENTELVHQLRLQKEEAENANNAKSKFLAAASHDLRQPLHALALFTSVLDEYINTPKVRGVVEQINLSVSALQDLFNALLDISRLDSGVMKSEKSNFYLQPILKRLSNEFDAQAHAKGLAITWPQTSAIVYSDPTLLEQILRNYLSNAIRYTNSGEVNVSCETKGENIALNVSDTGSGIPQDKLQEIYKEFHQLTNPERDRSKGLGLGLAIVRRTAKLLEHEINVSSEPGKGSSFGIVVESGRISDVKTDEVPEKQTHARYDYVGSLIVVIDDEASIREGMQKLFSLWEVDVITASSQEDALTQLRQQTRKPDGIIADYRLRENRTGIEAIHAINAEYKSEIPAVIVTGDIAGEHLRHVNNSGFQLLHKPVAPLKLRTFIENIQINKQSHEAEMLLD